MGEDMVVGEELLLQADGEEGFLPDVFDIGDEDVGGGRGIFSVSLGEGEEERSGEAEKGTRGGGHRTARGAVGKHE